MKTTKALRATILMIAFIFLTVFNVSADKDRNFKFENEKMYVVTQVSPNEYNSKTKSQNSPMVLIRNDKVYVSYINLDAKNIEFSFERDEFGGIAFFKCQCSDMSVQKVFDLSQLEKGNYILSIKTGAKEFMYAIET